MKVYIVQTSEYDDTSIHGVYADRATAERKMAELDEQAREKARRMVERRRARGERTPGYNPEDHIEDWRDHYMVTEYEVITGHGGVVLTIDESSTTRRATDEAAATGFVIGWNERGRRGG